MNYRDKALEVRINEAHLRLLEATQRRDREVAATHLADLVKQRSSTRVREMERAKGLR